jgi:hypothetical protein
VNEIAEVKLKQVEALNYYAICFVETNNVLVDEQILQSWSQVLI